MSAPTPRQEPAAPDDWKTPTSYLKRFGDAMQLLCGQRPADKMMTAWLASEDEALQEFAIEHGPAWAQGIVVIDAARLLSDSPTEGVTHGQARAAPQDGSKAPAAANALHESLARAVWLYENRGLKAGIVEGQPLAPGRWVNAARKALEAWEAAAPIPAHEAASPCGVNWATKCSVAEARVEELEATIASMKLRHAMEIDAAHHAAPIFAEASRERLHTFINAAGGEGLVLDGVDAADLYIDLFPERYAASTQRIHTDT